MCTSCSSSARSRRIWISAGTELGGWGLRSPFSTSACAGLAPRIGSGIMARPLWVEFAEAVCDVTRRGPERMGNVRDDAAAPRRLRRLRQAVEGGDEE